MRRLELRWEVVDVAVALDEVLATVRPQATSKSISIEAKIEDGNLSARLPTDAAFHLQAVAKEGHVSSDFSPMENRKGDDSEINEVIGDDATTKLSFRAGEGNIHVSEVIW